MSSAGRLIFRLWVPYAILVAGLVLTALLTYYVRRAADTSAELRFQTMVAETRHLVQMRLDMYVELLRAAAAHFAASENVTLGEFKLFVARLQAGERYPGIQGIGLARRFTPEELAAGDPALEELAREGRAVWPPGRRDEYTAIVALEPEDERNRVTLGFDMFTEGVRRAAMERARDTAEPAATAPVALVQEINGDRQAGFLIYMPVYRTAVIPDSVAARRSALYGFVYSPFRGDDLFRGILGPQRGLGFSVYDGTSLNPEALLHTTPLGAGLTASEALRAIAPVDVAGRQWTIAFNVARPFDASFPLLAAGVLAGGILLTLALFTIMRVQLGTWQATARHTAELRASEEALRATGERLRELVALEREARAEAQNADRAKDEFLAALSHELRTPVNAMLGWITMLRAGKVRQERRADALDVIERNARTQARLIEDLLDVSRIVAGKVRLDLQLLQVAPIAHTAVEALRPAAEAKGIGLRADIAIDMPAIMGDANRIQQIIWNLLSNAIKFTPAGGHAHLVVAADDGAVRLSVRDTGVGISPDFLPHVFERFRQADSSSTRAHSGVGLGLAIVRHLVELHNGTVEAQSAGENKGAYFVVRFPGAAPAEVLQRSRGDSGSGAAVSGVRVLVVEDDGDARDLLAEVLTAAGAVAMPVDSAEAALHALADERPDIIVSDIGMPGVNGYELIRRIRRLPGERGAIPSIAVTAYARPGDREDALQAGFDAHVTKPVDIDLLLRTIASLVENAGFKVQPF